MYSQFNSKIVGSFIVGFALVAGAYVFSNFGKPTGAFTAPEQQVATAAAPLRTPIEVADSDNNGIEDWRDQLITTEAIVIQPNDTGEPYVPPTTLTGQLGVNFVQNIVRARGYGEFGGTDEEVIADTIKTLERETSFAIYDTPDIQIMSTWDNEDIKNYANAAAAAINRNDIPDLDYELLILQDIINRNDSSRMQELKQLASIYENTKNDTLAIPVPEIFVKQHLDLINTYHAINKDIDAMTLSFEDPAFALLRLKRYEDDAMGLYLALQNMYIALEPYASLFDVNDPAVLFVTFSPSNQNRI